MDQIENSVLIRKAISAICGIFPTVEVYDDFLISGGAVHIAGSISAFAARTGAISENTPSMLRHLIETHTRQPQDLESSKKITMEELLDNKTDFLKTGLSGRGLSARINALLDKYDITLPKVSNTMLTRIKKEPVDTFHKQNVLRSLAFWVGFERDELISRWNYVNLMKICNQTERPMHVTDGVRVGFSLISRGSIIDHDIISWVKKNLKQHIKENIAPYGQWGTVRNYDITTLFIDFPKEEGMNELSSYQEGIRNAISVAHQMAVRWALSKFSTQKRFLSIGIAAGNLTTLDNYIQPLLNANLPGDPAIRVSDFARQCLLINDIRAIFNSQPKEVTLFNGEYLSIWWITGLWSSIYWPFIPSLLEDESLINRDLLAIITGLKTAPSGSLAKESAITAFFRSPQNAVLGIEITKTLFYRNRMWEALEILRIIVSVDQTNVNARSLRMMIYRNLGSQALSLSVALTRFKMAEMEAGFILKNESTLDEDFYTEYAVLKLVKAISCLLFMRKNPEDVFNQGIAASDISSLLMEAEHLFETAMSVSSSGIRSMYLLICTRTLRGILNNNPDVFDHQEKPVTTFADKARKSAMDMFYAIGWLDEGKSTDEQLNKLDMTLLRLFNIHNNALALETYRPTIYFCFAVVLWDFYPARTADTGRTVVKILKEAINITEKYRKDELYIYSFARLLGEMEPPDVFISRLSESIAKIERIISGLDGSRPFTDKEKNDAEQFLLLTHHLDNRTG